MAPAPPHYLPHHQLAAHLSAYESAAFSPTLGAPKISTPRGAKLLGKAGLGKAVGFGRVQPVTASRISPRAGRSPCVHSRSLAPSRCSVFKNLRTARSTPSTWGVRCAPFSSTGGRHGRLARPAPIPTRWAGSRRASPYAPALRRRVPHGGGGQAYGRYRLAARAR